MVAIKENLVPESHCEPWMADALGFCTAPSGLSLRPATGVGFLQARPHLAEQCCPSHRSQHLSALLLRQGRAAYHSSLLLRPCVLSACVHRQRHRERRTFHLRLVIHFQVSLSHTWDSPLAPGISSLRSLCFYLPFFLVHLADSKSHLTQFPSKASPFSHLLLPFMFGSVFVYSSLDFANSNALSIFFSYNQ